jgi:hypothetical protein
MPPQTDAERLKRQAEIGAQTRIHPSGPNRPAHSSMVCRRCALRCSVVSGSITAEASKSTWLMARAAGHGLSQGETPPRLKLLDYCDDFRPDQPRPGRPYIRRARAGLLPEGDPRGSRPDGLDERRSQFPAHRARRRREHPHREGGGAVDAAPSRPGGGAPRRAALEIVAGNEAIDLGFPGENGFPIVPAGRHVTTLRHLEPMSAGGRIRPIGHEVFGARRQCVWRREVGEIGHHH